jgi:NTP pyrophosphatase (non-canonical NTP hydrolase)
MRIRGDYGEWMMDLQALQQRLVEFAEARDWGVYHTPKNLAMALVVEAAEVVELFQWLTPEESIAAMEDPSTAFRVRDEIADVLSYVLQLAASCGVDPLEALAEKIERNERRFPAVKP